MAKQEKAADGGKKKDRYVYLYDQKTGIYSGPCDATNGDPAGVFTELTPPSVPGLDDVPVFRNGEWKVIKEKDVHQISAAIDNRNRLLAGSDYTQLEDSQVDKKAWAEYRQLLRDLPTQKDFPVKIEWPKVPLVVAEVK
jgi:hypothetical protein